MPSNVARQSTEAWVLVEFFHSRSPKETIAVVGLVNDKTRLEDDYVGNHGIVERIIKDPIMGALVRRRCVRLRKRQWTEKPR
jgi:hypothetical protein